MNQNAKTSFGFWLYLMTDCVLFASLFAVYAVLHKNIADGPDGQSIFDLQYVLIETFVLLASSFTSGLAILAAYRKDITKVVGWLGITGILGATFLTLELSEFAKLVHDGNSWQQSGFLSSYFTLVGTHGLHITVGLIWLFVLVLYVIKRGLTPTLLKRLTLFTMFWHFLDLIWIFIFTIVYLSSAVRI